MPLEQKLGSLEEAAGAEREEARRTVEDLRRRVSVTAHELTSASDSTAVISGELEDSRLEKEFMIREVEHHMQAAETLEKDVCELKEKLKEATLAHEEAGKELVQGKGEGGLVRNVAPCMHVKQSSMRIVCHDHIVFFTTMEFGRGKLGFVFQFLE